MITAKKISAAFLAAMLFVASAALCGCEAGGRNKKVSKDEKWYSVNRATVGSQFIDRPDVSYFNTRYVGNADGISVFYLQIEKRVPEGENPNNYSISQLQQNRFELYGEDGALVESVDFRDLIDRSGLFKLDPKDYAEIIKKLRTDDDKDKTDEQIMKENGYYAECFPDQNFMIKDNCLNFSVRVLLPSKDGSSWEDKIRNVAYDVKNGALKDLGEARDIGGSVLAAYDLEDYWLTLVSSSTGGVDLLKVTLPDGSDAEYKLSSVMPDTNVQYISTVFYLGDGKIIFQGDVLGEQRFFEMDLNTGKCLDYMDDVSWLRKDISQAGYISGAGNVVIDQNGIRKLDFEKKCRTEYFSFSSCNINRNDTYNMSVLDIRDDHIYLSSKPVLNDDLSGSVNDVTYLYTLSLEKENPNAGKTVLRATSLGYFSYAFCEAVCRFNETNANYFIKLDDDYTIMSKMNSGEISFWDEDYSKKRSKFIAELSYKLALDLANGDGPDIVFGEYDYSNLNSSKYLLDLNDEIGSNDVFDNVVNACKTDGKLYQYPVAFSVSGLVVPASSAGVGQYGFTYGRYKELVKGPCNGKDPVSVFRDQMEYFNACMNVMPDTYLKDGIIDFDNKDFRELAEYIKDNAGDMIEPEEDMYTPVEQESRGIVYDDGITISRLISFYGDSTKDIRVMGLPSGDGRGPAIDVSVSVGISANTKEKAACVEFVRTLLSEDIQEMFEEFDDATPVNTGAFRKTGIKAVEKYNAKYLQNSKKYSRQQLRLSGLPWCEVDKSAVDEYEKAIRSCSCVISEDPAVSMIVKEEMPAYLTGQKSLDDVIGIINDRVKTVASERT